MNDELQWTERDCVPACGVYMLMLGTTVQYIGQSIDIHGRVGTHRRTGRIVFDSVRVMLLSEGREDLERELIQKHQPPFNRTNTERAKIRDAAVDPTMPRSIRWTGDNYERAKELARREDRSVNQWINLTVERLWKALPSTEIIHR